VPSFRAEISFRKGILASLEYFHKNPEICVENAETSALMDRILGKYESAFS
jgi:hypothetical protein